MMAKIERFMDRISVGWFSCGLAIALLIWAFEPMTLWLFLLAVIFGPLTIILAALFIIGGMFV